jgi:transposase-like protein
MSKKDKKKTTSTAGKALALGTALSLGTFGFTAIGTGAAFGAPTANTAAASLNTTKVIKLANGKTRIRVDLADNLRGKTVIIRTSRIVNGERRVITLGRIKLTKTGKGVLTVSRKIRVDDRLVVTDGIRNIVNSKISVIDDRTPAVAAPAPTPAPPASGGGSSGGSDPAAVFSMTEGATGVWTLSTGNGNVVVTESGTNYVFTPSTGTAITKAKADVTTVVVSTITLSGTATVLKQLTAITGAVTVTGPAISVADANSLNAITSAVVTATLAAETLANLGALTETGNAYTITVDDAADAALNATDLSNLGNKTIGTVTVTNAVVISGSAAEVAAALVTEASKVVAATAKVTVTGTIGVSDVNAIDAVTTGAITATLTTGALLSFSTLTGTGNVYTITVDDAADDALNATDLSALGGKTTGTVTVSNAVVISGTVAQVKAALVDVGTKVVAATAKVTVTGVAEALDITAIRTATTGTIDGSGITDINGTAADIVQAIDDLDTAPTNFDSVLPADASEEDLTAINNINGGGTATKSS